MIFMEALHLFLRTYLLLSHAETKDTRSFTAWEVLGSLGYLRREGSLKPECRSLWTRLDLR